MSVKTYAVGAAYVALLDVLMLIKAALVTAEVGLCLLLFVFYILAYTIYEM